MGNTIASVFLCLSAVSGKGFLSAWLLSALLLQLFKPVFAPLSFEWFWRSAFYLDLSLPLGKTAVPLKYEPVEVFMAGVDQSRVDKSTEEWLDGIEDRLDYGKWYCGHYHTEKKIDRVEIMFENYGVFCGG